MCRSGCSTQDHASWGECARAANLKIAYCQSAAGKDYTLQKRHDAELDAYAEARKGGLQPAGTKMSQVRKAVEAAS